MGWTHPWAEKRLSIDAGGHHVVDLPAVPTDPESVRGMFAQHPAGLAAVCAEVDGAPVGMLVSSFAVGISYEPPLALFSAQKSSRTWPSLATAQAVGVSVLSEANADAVGRLASRSADRFEGSEVHCSDSGAIFLGMARLWLECTVHRELDVGDHRLVILEVTRASSGRDLAPLIHLDGSVLSFTP